MSLPRNLTSLQFQELLADGQNYLSWKANALAFLRADGCLTADANFTLVTSNEGRPSAQTAWRTLISLRSHLEESLQHQYLHLGDPKELWQALEQRFGHIQLVLLPQAEQDWDNLRLMDFAAVSKYNSALCAIVAQLRLCGKRLTDDQLMFELRKRIALAYLRDSFFAGMATTQRCESINAFFDGFFNASCLLVDFI